MKKKIFSVAATVALTGAFATSVSAEEYTIDKGDTLWGISKKYDVSVNQLKSWNDLSSNLIYPNQQLTVSKESSSSSKKSSNDTTYTVKSGDTLYKISNKYGISVDDLMDWNNLDSTLIYPGDKFKVSGQASSEPEVSASSTNHDDSSSNEAASESKSEESSDSSSDVVKEFTAEATAYTAFCTGCSGVTATGVDLRANPDQKVIAVDPDVIPLGSKVYVEGYGEAIAADTGGAINGNRIDVFIPEREDALDFGRQSVQVKVLSE
ncbi:LysM peptidoglycan-binding and 3D domain-containing protein [Halobacillus halophilus]|uniref:LysM peptidoglycan-binding and 3D domain-containing protein n=1 Tax=Halobacillus halophilus TaxID=1570 RepID=UPI001CD4270C|nr:3D domain-containing protein [Halobacillus halophilus]MCA1009377.1 LysM peptidoglycan-binding domain-containing protein [Halobacillus halophilus]